MHWYYDAGGGQRQGPISESEFDRLIASGTITPQTLVWREGMPGWIPLREARPTAQGAADGSETGRCDACGNLVSVSELIQIGERNVCASCKPTVLHQIQSGAPLPPALAFDRTGPAWEQRAELGTVKAAWETIKAVLTNPVDTFARMKREGGLGTSLFYNMLVGSIGGIVGLIYQLVFNLGMGSSQDEMAANLPPGLAPFFTGSFITVAFAILLPVLIAIGAFIYSGILHLSLMICGGAKQPFETTFRVYNYASGSAGALQLIPVCGAMVSGIWALVAMCIGIAKAHEISTGRAVLAVLLPTVVCCIGIIAICVAFAGAAYAATAQGIR